MLSEKYIEIIMINNKDLPKYAENNWKTLLYSRRIYDQSDSKKCSIYVVCTMHRDHYHK